MRASATSRIVSPALFPQSKPDAGKADDASPFALLLNTVQAKPAAPQKDAQNKDTSSTGQNSNSDAASQASAPDLAAQAAVAINPVKPGKSENQAKSGDKPGKTDAVTSDAGQPSQQANIPAPPPPAGPQISIIIATLADGKTAGRDDKDTKVQAPGDTVGAADTQTGTQASQSGPSMQTPQTASQAAQAVTSPTGQAAAPQTPPPAPLPEPVTSTPPAVPHAQTSATVASTVQPVQQAPVQSSGQPTDPQTQPSGPANTVQTAAAPAQSTSTPTQPIAAPNIVQPASAPAPPAIPQAPTNPAQNTVQANRPQQPAVPPAKPQPPASITVQNSVQQITDQPLPTMPVLVQTSLGNDAAQDKIAKTGGDKRDPKSTDSATPAAPQAQASPVQPDPSQISAAAATIAAAIDQDAGDDVTSQDAPGIQAAGTASAAINGPAKAQSAKDLQDALAARQAPQPSGQAANSSSAGQPATAQQDTDPFLEPWQAKAQKGGADGTGDAKAAASQTNVTSPDQIKQALAPQAVAASAAPVARPADASGSAVPVIGTPQSPGEPGAAAAPPFAQTVQVSTPSPNMPALAVDIAARSQSGVKQFDIRLDPPELGHVEVRLSIDATGKASAHLSADQPQTLDLLQKDAPVLTRALRDAGLNVSQNGLNFSLRQQQGDAGAGTNQKGGGNPRSFTLAATSSLDAASAGAAWRAPATGRLDIRV